LEGTLDIVLSEVHWKENTGGYRAKQSSIPEYQNISPTENKLKLSEGAGATKTWYQ